MLETRVDLISKDLYEAHKPSCTVVFIGRTKSATETTSLPEHQDERSMRKSVVMESVLQCSKVPPLR